MSTSDAPPPFEASRLLGTRLADRYTVARSVARGANTLIFDGRDDETGRRVTLKVLRPELTDTEGFAERFEQTLRSVGALSHPNIVAVYDWGTTRVDDVDAAYVVVEYLTGGSLRDMFDRGRQLTPSQALVVGLDACRGLDHAHRRGFVHPELTPSKLVFGDDRRMRIVDFGVARLLAEPSSEHPDSVPNHVAAYASPEQASGEPATEASDIYALGLMLHEAVTGELPFRRESTVATLAARVGRLMPVSADLGPLATVLERAGRPDPQERPSAAEFGAALVAAAAKLPRPEPLPLLSSGLFDTPIEDLRAPDDPTGGVVRPEAPTQPIVVVPLDTPDDPVRDRAPAEPVDPADGLVITPLDTDPEPVPPVRTVAPTATMSAVPPTPVATAAPAPRRRVPWWAIAALVVLIAGAAGAVVVAQMMRTPVHTVPDVVGATEAEALNLVAPFGWEVTVERERSDEMPTAGQVVRTSPRAGLELAEGEPLIIVASDGPVLREIPEMVGRPFADVSAAMNELKLSATADEAYDEEVPEGIVVSWSAPDDPTLTVGSMVEPGTRISLVVSAGPEPRTVPDLVGTPFGEAERILKDMRLEIVESGREFSDDFAADEVIGQDTQAGAQVERGTTIAVLVSKGPDVVAFPDLSSFENYAQAEPVLRQAGFVPTLVLGDAQSPIQSVKIGDKKAKVGRMYPRGTEVAVVAVELKPPTTPPETTG